MSEPADGAESSRPRVALVFGGRSSEHGVSCLTAGEVARVIDSGAYEVVPVGIATDGRWVLESFDDDDDRLALHDGRLPLVDADRSDVVLAPDPSRRELVVGAPGEVPQVLGQVDVVFPLLHGPWGEDGTLQGLLEMAGVRYVGAGVLASAVGMDKPVQKALLSAAGLPVLPAVAVPARSPDLAGVHKAVDGLGYPVFVKPARAGSSMGISRVERDADLDAAIEEARRHDPKVLIEPGVLGARELECGVLERLDGGRPEPSVVGEVSLAPGSGHAFYDFTAKYLDGTARIDVPADLPAQVSDQIRELAVQAFEAIGCEGLARVDFFLLPDGQVVINEVNTMPGFTATSMFPMLWKASGVDYAALVDRLLRLALGRTTGLR